MCKVFIQKVQVKDKDTKQLTKNIIGEILGDIIQQYLKKEEDKNNYKIEELTTSTLISNNMV